VYQGESGKSCGQDPKKDGFSGINTAKVNLNSIINISLKVYSKHFSFIAVKPWPLAKRKAKK